jgi:hypothetical protein
VTETIEYLATIPGSLKEEDSRKHRFFKNLSKHLTFVPGVLVLPTEGLEKIVSFTQVKDGAIDSGIGLEPVSAQWLTYLVSNQSIQEIGELLEKEGLRHVMDPKFFSLCCEDATKQTRAIFVRNYHNENLLIVASEKKLWSATMTAFIPDYGPKDEDLERKIIEEEIRFRESGGCGRPTGCDILNNEEELKKYLEKALRDVCERDIKREGDVFVLRDINLGRTFTFPPGAEVKNAKSLIEIEGQMPFEVKRYEDGKILVQVQEEPLPLSRYFNPRQGVDRKSVSYCQDCESRVLEEYRTRVLQRLNDGGKNGYFDINIVFRGETARNLRYVFNPQRIRIETEKKEILPRKIRA